MIMMGEQLKHLVRNLSQYHFVHHQSDMDWHGIESGPL
jgi:hypothetical protein